MVIGGKTVLMLLDAGQSMTIIGLSTFNAIKKQAGTSCKALIDLL